MPEEINKVTKWTFTVHVFVAGLFAIMYWLPSMTLSLFGMVYTPVVGALCGVIASLFFGLAFMSVFGAIAKEWKQVKIVVIGEVFWLGAGLVTTIINYTAMQTTAIVFFIVGGVFFVLFLISFLLQQKTS
ncbi:MAG TPA: hypothetical protein VKM55_11960 [Candidatus Lokiarchaeia archaeon]|nr:hypothetical protein [Candidatus Lokiarchaeia archaeon]